MAELSAAEEHHGRTVTFYSYKGGTGRSLTLANVAWVLAASGKRVLAIDWDLEAPGLHTYFRPFLVDPELASIDGMIDLVWNYSLAAVTPPAAGQSDDAQAEPSEDGSAPPDGAGWVERELRLLDYTVSLDWDFRSTSDDGVERNGCLDLLPAGRQDAGYAARVNTFDWQHFYERLDGGLFLDHLLERMRGQYDWILIDSRTGVSDTSGICTVHMPDRLVVCFTLNNQSIRGAVGEAASVTKQRTKTPLPVLPVPMRVDRDDSTRAEERLSLAKRRFQPFLWHLPAARQDEYWRDVEMPYLPLYSYEEVLAAFQEPTELSTQGLLRPMRLLAGWVIGEPVAELPALDKEKAKEALRQFQTPAEEATRLDDLEGLATYFRRAWKALERGDHQERDDLRERLLLECDQLPPPVDLAELDRDRARRLFLHLGTTAYHLTLDDLAKGCLDKALEVAEGAAERAEVAAAIEALAALVDRLEDRRELLEMAFDLYSEGGDSAEMARLRAEIDGLDKSSRGEQPSPVTEAWDFSERDAITQYLEREVAEMRRDDVRHRLRSYLEALRRRLEPLPILAISGSGSPADVALSAVYTALDTTTWIHAGGEAEAGWQMDAASAVRDVEATDSGGDAEAGSRAHPEGGGPEPGATLPGDPEYAVRLFEEVRRAASANEGSDAGEARPAGRAMTAVEAAAACRHLVLLGAPGSGKSSFVRYLALCLAGEMGVKYGADLQSLNRRPAGKSSFKPWPHGALLPVYVELRRFVASNTFRHAASSGADVLLEFLGHEQTEASTIRLNLQALLEHGGALLVLDGLDETPGADGVRDRLRSVIEDFAHRFPHVRILVTSRPYAYAQGSSWRLDGFEVATLAPLGDPQIERLVGAWYRQLEKRGQIDLKKALEQAHSLTEEIASRPTDLRQLAESPLMLTMMTDLHASRGGSLPATRADLYERSVELLFDRWNDVRGTPGLKSVRERLGISVEALRRALDRLAYRVHGSRGLEQEGAAEIDAGELKAELELAAPQVDKKELERLMDDLHQRSGLLLAESRELYRFPHRMFQEYLAASHLVRTDFPKRLGHEVEQDPQLWREVFLMAAAKTADQPFAFWALVSEVVPKLPRRPAGDDPRFLLALFAGLAIRESGLYADPPDAERKELERVRRWLAKTLELGALPTRERARAGRVLAILGDPRPGVGVGSDGLPDIEWVEVPAGPFLMGSGESDGDALDDERPQHALDLPGFRIARYPVTNAQYAAFVDDGGYSEKWRECWTEAGWKWLTDCSIDGPSNVYRERFLLANHPRVGVSWYEALAFCRWLGERSGTGVTLPSEAQWEKAARGLKGDAYPWGESFEPDRCNSAESELDGTTAVGMFPRGASVLGAHDLAGNQFEWTVSKRGYYPYRAEDGREEIESSAARVSRGGAFGSRRYVRCAYRDNLDPHSRRANVGFRPVALIR